MSVVTESHDCLITPETATVEHVRLLSALVHLHDLRKQVCPNCTKLVANTFEAVWMIAAFMDVENVMEMEERLNRDLLSRLEKLEAPERTS